MESTTPILSGSDEVVKPGGEPFQYDPQFHGPVKDRSCTDVICLCLFLSFIAGWAVISIFAFKHGNPKLLFYPMDSNGNVCGLGKFNSTPYLYFFDLTKCANPTVIYKGCPTPEVCVSHCPNETMFYLPETVTDKDKDKLICKVGTDMSKPAAELLKNQDCASLYLRSVPLLRRCIPSHLIVSPSGNILSNRNETVEVDGKGLKGEVIEMATKILAKFLNVQEMGKEMFRDLKNSWKLILIGMLLCMLVSLLWITLMRWITGPMVWLSIVLVLLLSGYATYYSTASYLKVKDSKQAPTGVLQFTTSLNSYADSKNTWLVLAVISGLIFVILLLVLLFLRKRIFIAIALIEEGSRAIGCMLTTLLFPIFPYFLELIIFIFWGAIALYIASSGRATISSHKTASNSSEGKFCIPDKLNLINKTCLFSYYGGYNHLYSAQIYNLFVMLWAVFFCIGLCQLSLAGAFSTYYWTYNKSDVPKFTIVVGVYRCLRFHLGSVAFGSFLIAVVRLIRIALEFIEEKCKKYENPVTRAIMCCMKCCFWVLEKFLRFISKNAYIMIAAYGKNFCASAKSAFNLLIRNVIRVVVLDKVTEFLFFIGKLVIVGIAAVASFYVFSGRIAYFQRYLPPLNYNLLPVLVIIIGAYLIASVFFNVYSMAVNTLFLCFLEDLERNDGSKERPYFMSKKLMKILDKQNKFRDPVT